MGILTQSTQRAQRRAAWVMGERRKDEEKEFLEMKKWPVASDEWRVKGVARMVRVAAQKAS